MSSLLMMINVAALCLTNCQSIGNESFRKGGANLSHLGLKVYGNPSTQTGEKLKNWNEESQINPEEVGDYAEGDILFPARLSKNGLVSETSRWPTGEVPYQIAGTFTMKELQVIRKAMEQYHRYTCITSIVNNDERHEERESVLSNSVFSFRKRNATDSDWVSITNSNTGCWSVVGRLGGRQELNLQSPACLAKIGTVLHELLHTIGFQHEQNRWERDSYVAIHWKNIQKGKDGNFKKAEKDVVAGFGVSYDYGSVMHYSEKAFSQNGRRTISVLKNTGTKVGQRTGFSTKDLRKVWAMYQCPPPRENYTEPRPDIDGNDPNNPGDEILNGLVSILFP